MRKGLHGVLICALGLVPVAADPATAKSCAGKPGAIGLSRVVEIDTSGGPRFGNMQYPDIDFLKPGEVVLTFDDGPLRKYTKPVLKALSDHCTKATFFMVGRMAVADPEMVREVARQGHTVALHTWSHKNLGRRSLSGSKYEFELGMSAVSKALGDDISPFFRFPYLAHSGAMMSYLRKRNVGMFSIDVDSLDFRTRSPQTMINRVLSRLKRKGKGILLFHDIQRSTAGGTRKLLSELNKRGYKVVHTISKQRAKTLPEFDKIAVKELTRRKQLAALEPQQALNPPWPYIDAGDPQPQPLTNMRKRIKKKKSTAVVPPNPVKRPANNARKQTTNEVVPEKAAAKATPPAAMAGKPEKGKLIEPNKAAAAATRESEAAHTEKETTKQTVSTGKEAATAREMADPSSDAKGTDGGFEPAAIDTTKASQPDGNVPAAAMEDGKASALGSIENNGEPKASAENKNEKAAPSSSPAEASKSEDDTSSVASDLRFARFRDVDGDEERDLPETSARMTMGQGLNALDQ